MRDLALGFLDTVHVPYEEGRPEIGHDFLTNGALAEDLEARYRVVEIFFETQAEQISDTVLDVYADDINSGGEKAARLKGSFSPALAKIQTDFVAFIKAQRLDYLVRGVPTLSSVLGISHVRQGNVGPPRPSFIDTGQYIAAFRAWMA